MSNTFKASSQQWEIWNLVTEQGVSPWIVDVCLELSAMPVAEEVEACLRAELAASEIFGTRLVWLPDSLQLLQQVEKPALVIIHSTLAASLEDEISRARNSLKELMSHDPFAPHFRAELIQKNATTTYLHMAASAHVADARTMRLLAGRICERYCKYQRIVEAGTDTIQGSHFQYADYAEWQDTLFKNHQYDDLRRIFKEQNLSRSWESPLAFEKRQEKSASGEQKIHKLSMKPSLLARIQGKELLVLWVLFLIASRKCRDVTIAVQFPCRQTEGLDGVYGPFSQAIAVTFAATDEKKLVFSTESEQISEEYDAVAEFQDYYHRLLNRGISQNEHSYCPYGFEYMEFEDIEVSGASSAQTLPCGGGSHWPARLKLVIHKTAKQHETKLQYADDYFGEEEIGILAARFEYMFEQVFSAPGGRNNEIVLIPQSEINTLINAWNATPGSGDHDSAYHPEFERQAASTPDAPAIEYEGTTISYRELNEKANQFAGFLRSQGLNGNEVIGLCAHRSPPVVIALLGILKAGCAYLPLDPDYPVRRLAYMIHDSGVDRVVTTANLEPRLSGLKAGLELLVWEDIEAGRMQESRKNRGHATANTKTAYIIYTSGSTGTPKGVKIGNSSLLNYLSWATARYRIREGSGAIVHSSISFDLTVTSLLGPLLVGQKVILISEKNVIDQLINMLSSSTGFTLLKVTPSHLDMLNARLSPGQLAGAVKSIVIGGEALYYRQVNGFLSQSNGASVFNEYGPTEATVGCCVEEILEPREDGEVPIGRPIANTRLYVLDTEYRPVGIGEVGELYIAGEGLALEYVNKPEITQERFIHIQVPGLSGEERVYKTGDVARYRADGKLVFLGRNDRQIKIRGYRVEIGEIESLIAAQENVKQCVIAQRKVGSSENKQLVGYLVWSHGDSRVDLAQFESKLREHLPEYMVPAVWVELEELPLDRHGKVDFDALPEPEKRHAYVMPETEQEKILCEIWEQVIFGLKADKNRVGVEDNYFTLGGDSIRSIQIITLARSRGIAFGVEQLFANPTIKGLLASLEGVREIKTESSIYRPFMLISEKDRKNIPSYIEDAYPLTVLQGAMIFHNELDAGIGMYHDIFSYKLKCKVDFGLMRKAAEGLALRHAALRTTFDLSTFSEPMQLVHRGIPPIIGFEDISDLAVAEQDRAIHDWLVREKQIGMDFSKLPLAKFFIHKRGEESIQFTLSFHHSVIDGWSDASMLTELFVDYLQMLDGRQMERESPRSQFHEFVELERRTIADEKVREYWRESLLKDFEFTVLPKSSFLAGPDPVIDCPVDIDPTLSEKIKSLSKELNVPIKNVLLASHLKVLSLLSNQTDVTTCMVASGRPETPEADKVLGLFINSIPIRIELKDESWEDFLRAVFDKEKEILPYRRFPLGKLREMNGGQTISDSLFYFTHYHVFDQAFQAGDLEFEALIPHEVSSFPFVANFHVSPLTGRVHCSLTCNGKYFTSADVCDFALLYEHVLRAIVDHSGESCLRSNVLPSQLARSILDVSRGPQEDISRYTRIEEEVEAKARLRKNNVAVCFQEIELTYRDLDRNANSFANFLKARGARLHDRIGVCLERSEKMVVALLGILKAGCCYVPMDPGYPRNRLNYLAEKAALNCVVSDHASADKFRELGVMTIDVERNWDEVLLHSVDKEGAVGASVEDLAYVIFTSGSTGEPKGVQITHRNVANFFRGMDREIGSPAEGDSWLALTNITFDISVLEIFWTLSRGVKLVIQADEDRVLISRPKDINVSEAPTRFSLFYFAADDDTRGPEKYRLLLEGAEFADKNAFHAVWIPERHFHSFGGLYPNPVVVASAVAALTSRVNIRSGSVVLPLHDPIRVAEDWSVVDNLSNGRIGLSLASGWHNNDFVFAPQKFATRKESLDADCELLKELWSGKSLEIVRNDEKFQVEIFPKPVQPELPLWMTAAGNPETFRKAGEKGVNILTHLLGQSIEDLRAKIGIYRQAREDAGFSRNSGTVSLMIHTFVWPEQSEVEEIVRVPFREYLKNSVGLIGQQKSADDIKKGATEQDMEELIEAAFRRYYSSSGLFGTPESCLARAEELKSIGVDEICCLIDFGVPTEQVLESLKHLRKLQDLCNVHGSWPSRNYSIVDQIQRHGISHIQMTPSLAQQIMVDEAGPDALAQVKKILVGGEALPQRLADSITGRAGKGKLMNMYGPTEATIWSTVKCFRDEGEKVTIGRPILNTSAYVMNSFNQPVPFGVAGELHLGGDGISPGYIGSSELTKERFYADPMEGKTGKTLYKTGDVVRLLRNGELEFISRLDFQIKVRGYRVEPGEIENTLHKLASVSEAVVVPFSSSPAGGYDHLVAYVKFKAEEVETVDAVQNYLKEELPDHMRPSHVVVVENMPLNTSGKIDRQALPAPEFVPGAKRGLIAQYSSEVSVLVAGIWADVLKREHVSANDNFFELGGFSIQASQSIAKMRTVFKRDLPLRSIFEAPTPEQYARYIQDVGANDGREESKPSSIVSRDRSLRSYPLSRSQRGIWFVDRLSGGSTAYNEPAVVRITGSLDIDILRRCLDTLAERHEALRLKFSVVDDVPVQSVCDPRPFDFSVTRSTDSSHWMSEIENLVRTPFDIELGYLARALLIERDGDHVLCFVLHHLISDGWSMRVLLQDMAELYQACRSGRPAALPKLKIQYLDYVMWQQDLMSSDEFGNSLRFWRDRLEGQQNNEIFPPDKVRPEKRRFNGETEFFSFSGELTKELKQLSKSKGVTLFMTLMTLYKILFHCRTGLLDITVGTDSANRTRPEMEKLIGLFVNQLVLKTNLYQARTYDEVLDRVRQGLLESYMHQDVPYESIVESAGSHQAWNTTPLFQVKFVFQDNVLTTFEMDNVNLEPVSVIRGTSKFDMLLNANDDVDGLSFSLEYDVSLYESETIRHFIHQYTALAELLARSSASTIQDFKDTIDVMDDEYIKSSTTRIRADKRKSLGGTKRQAISFSEGIP